MARKAPRTRDTATSEDDSDSIMTFNDSGAVTPSTAATSVAGSNLKGPRGKVTRTDTRQGEEEEEEDDDEPVVAPGSRSTPRRSAAAAASKKFAQPMALDGSSDLSEVASSGDDDDDQDQDKDSDSAEDFPKPNGKLDKGKGKAKEQEVLILSSGDEDEDSDDIRKIRDAAKGLRAAADDFSARAAGNGSVDAATLGKQLMSKLKGKGKATQPKTFYVSIPSSATSARMTRTSSSASKVSAKSRGKSSSKSSTKAKKDVKGKGKRKAISSSEDDSDGSAFEPTSDSEEDSDSDVMIIDSDVEMQLLEFDSDLDSEDDTVDHKAKLKKLKKREKDPNVDRVRVPVRKGVEITHAQRKAMKKMTQYEKNELALCANHPELATCWTDLAASPIPVPTKAEQPVGLTQKLLPFQLEGLHWMLQQEKGTWGGGMLADEMGMGKTIQTISLILSDYKPGDKKLSLVLAPTVAIMQWKNEFEKFTSGMKILVFHGSNRIDNVREVEKYDVILTSYAVLESGYRREHKGFVKKGKTMKEDSILHKVLWNRVILDEAHNIKDRACNTAKATFALKSKYRWCLSGTPLQNRVGELYSLIRFLGADPFAHYFCKKCDCKSLHWLCNMGPCSECGHSGMQHVCYWNNEVLKPIQFGGATSGEGERAFNKLSSLLQRMMLRRTKVERADDLGLPPRVVNVRRDYFTEEEEELYQSLFKDVKRRFNTYADEGTVLNNYSNIFTLITRMRQMADHPSLVTHSKTAMSIQHAPGDKPSDILTCRLCLDEAEDAVATSCRHIFCRECIRQYMETAVVQRPECPVCHNSMSIDLDQEAIEQDTTGRQGILSRLDPSKDRTSTKIEALCEELSKLRTEDHTLKSLVFSQFTSMLDLVARRLQLKGFKLVRLQGSMTPAARDNTIKYFMNNADVTVFLISLKAGGVALNLTEASRVWILDPWWNPAVELQAMDRIHRLGQHRPVVVTRFIIENSIESRILELQKKKENLAASALGDDDKAMGRLTPEDLRFLFSL